MSRPKLEALTALAGKGYDLTLEDMLEFGALSTQVDWEDACRAIDAVKLVIDDPIYSGNIPPDYFD